jgi:hypothetical protein
VLNNTAKNKYVQKVLLNQIVKKSMSIQFEDIKAGSELIIIMGDKPI